MIFFKTRLPLLLQSLTMTMWVGYGGCHTEIATGFLSPCNDKSHNRNNSSIICNDNVWVPSLRAKQSNPQSTIHPTSSLRDFVEVVAIHKSQKVNIKIENKKKSSSFATFVIARLRRSRGNPQPPLFYSFTKK